MKLAKKNKVIILTATAAVVILSISGYLVYANKNTPKNLKESIGNKPNKEITLENSNAIIEEKNKEVTTPSNENTTTEQKEGEDKNTSANNSENKEKDTNTNSNVSASVGNVPKNNDSSGNTKPKEPEQTTPPPSTPPPPTPKYTVRGDLATQVFNSVNKYRTDNGMSGLTRVSSYNSLAEKYLAYRASIGDKPDITNVWANYCKVQSWNDIIEMPDIIGDSLQGSGSTSVVVIEYNGVFHICFAVDR